MLLQEAGKPFHINELAKRTVNQQGLKTFFIKVKDQNVKR